MTSPQIGDTWYRYDAHVYEDGSVKVFLSEYKVTRITNACVILDVYGIPKTVLKDARKRYAYPTRELAYQPLIKRSEWRKRWCDNAASIAEAVYNYMKEHPTAPEDWRCPKCGAQADERFDCCEVHELTAPATQQPHDGDDNGPQTR